MNLLSKFLNKTDFENYDDFKKLSLSFNDDFNFAYDVTDEYAKISPDKMALVWCNSDEEEKFFTFKEISEQSNKLANAMHEMGLQPGDSIITMLNRRWEYWIVLNACCKVGVTIIPATHLLTPKDIAYRCNSAGAKYLFATSEPDLIEHINYALGKCLTIKECFYTKKVKGFRTIEDLIKKQNKELNTEIKRPDSHGNMLCYFTSGTTGMPKMVQHNYYYPLGHIITAKYWQKVIDDGLHFTMAETGWAKCSWGKIFGQWIAGSAVFAYDYNGRFTPTDILPLLKKYNITTFCAPPTIYRFLIKEDLSQYDFSSLKHSSTAGEALNPEVFKQYYRLTGQKIYEGFGQTETTVILGNFAFSKMKLGSLGLPSPIYDVELLDDEGNIVPSGTVGEISIRIKNNQVGLVANYKDDPALTQKSLGGEFYRTGDLASTDPDGYFWFEGRKDDIIKSSGYRIGPYEVESALMEHASVLECAITGVPDPVRGQIVKATIVLHKKFQPSEELKKELQNYVKSVTAPYKYPRIIEFVDELPKTTSGKIRHIEIRNRDK